MYPPALVKCTVPGVVRGLGNELEQLFPGSTTQLGTSTECEEVSSASAYTHVKIENVI